MPRPRNPFRKKKNTSPPREDRTSRPMAGGPQPHVTPEMLKQRPLQPVKESPRQAGQAGQAVPRPVEWEGRRPNPTMPANGKPVTRTSQIEQKVAQVAAPERQPERGGRRPLPQIPSKAPPVPKRPARLHPRREEIAKVRPPKPLVGNNAYERGTMPVPLPPLPKVPFAPKPLVQEGQQRRSPTLLGGEHRKTGRNPVVSDPPKKQPQPPPRKHR